jgi:hypothetical protein
MSLWIDNAVPWWIRDALESEPCVAEGVVLCGGYSKGGPIAGPGRWGNMRIVFTCMHQADIYWQLMESASE